MSIDVCAKCGEPNMAAAQSCRRCGAPVAAVQEPTPHGQDYQAVPGYGASPAPYGAPVSPDVEDAQKTARKGLIIGIVGLLCLGFILGILAIKYGRDARKRLVAAGVSQGQGMALAATILGVFDFVGAIAGLIVAIATK